MRLRVLCDLCVRRESEDHSLSLYLTVKKCSLYVELNHILVVAGSDGQHNVDTWDATDWSVCTSKVCSGYLKKALCTESRLEKTIRLNLKHPH